MLSMAFPSRFMRITCDRCGKDRMLNEAHTAHRDLPIREFGQIIKTGMERAAPGAALSDPVHAPFPRHRTSGT
jgi:hypothetical protein